MWIRAVAIAMALSLIVVLCRWASGHSDIASTQAFDSCDTDPTLSGFQGYCVERRTWPELLFVAGRSELRVNAVYDGAPDGRQLVHHDPFDQASELRARWTHRELRVFERGAPQPTTVTFRRTRLRALRD